MSHGAVASKHLGKERVQPLLGTEWAAAVASEEPRLRAALRFLERLTQAPATVDADFVAELLETGLAPGALEQATLMAALFAYMNRMVDAFGADVTPEQAERISGVLDTMGGAMERMGRVRPWKRFGGAVPAQMQVQLEILRSGPGDCPAPLRSAIEAHVARACGVEREQAAEPLPPAVAALVDTLAHDAHGVTDAHIQALVGDWSEEAVYEMVFTASFAAALGRTERAAQVLAGFPGA